MQNESKMRAPHISILFGQKLNEAVWSEKPAPEVVGQVAAMRRGWDALVASAKAS